MTILEIPLNVNHPHHKQEIELFGHTFNLEFEFFDNENFWVMHIYDEQKKALALGIKLIPNWPLFKYKNITFVMLGDSHLVAYESL